MLKNVILGAGILATVLAILIFSCKIPVGDRCNGIGGAKGDVVLWGTMPEEAVNAITQVFNPQAKSYAVRYKYIPAESFNQRLLEALASGTGPDMIMAPYQTILNQGDRLYPFQIQEKNFKDLYVDGASIFLTPQGALALPVSIEPMVLFYNRTLFSKHSIVNPPQYWDDVVSVVPSLTISQGGHFVESGISLGTPNTRYGKDIMMAIVAQLGQSPIVRIPNQDGSTYYSVQANEAVNEGGQVLPLTTTARFYTQFGDPGQTTYSWNDAQLGDASDVFVGEKLAMYIGYSGELQTLRARNPRGDFEMTYLPQTKNYNTFATGMRMYGLATLKSSKNPLAALTVEAQFAGAGVSPSIAAIVGGVPALRSYAATQGLDQVVARSMLVARGWYDSHQQETSLYANQMVGDIINYRYGVNDAVSLFISRLKDLYSK
jgi:ABC-type glycerol-3-phosphate transport system substrate-binding protein